MRLSVGRIHGYAEEVLAQSIFGAGKNMRTGTGKECIAKIKNSLVLNKDYLLFDDISPVFPYPAWHCQKHRRLYVAGIDTISLLLNFVAHKIKYNM